MKESILNKKRILAVDDEQDILEVLKEEILSEAPECHLDIATSYEKAFELLVSRPYDLAILDIMGVRGFDLLKFAISRQTPIPAVMLTAHAFSPESLKRSIEKGARAYLPKEKLGSVMPFLEDVLNHGHAWKRIMKEIGGVFNKSWGPDWRKSDSAFWNEFEKRIAEKK